MVLVQRGPQDTGKEYPRTVEDASLPSSSSSWPPLRPRISPLFLRLSSFRTPLSLSLSPPCKYAPPETHQDLYSCKEKRRLLQMLHTERDIIPFFRSLSLLSFSPFFLPISIFPPLFLFLYFISLPLYFEFTSSTPRNLS